MYKYEIFDGLNNFITSGYKQIEGTALLTCLNYICFKENNLKLCFSEDFYSANNEYVSVYFVEDKEDYLMYVIMIIKTD